MTLAGSPWFAEWRAGLAGVRSLVVLTGAGMSAESGVPTFRGPGGLWEDHRPEDLATPEAFERDPATVWRWYRWRGERVAAARPHAGHRALAWLEAEGGFERFTLVTQNVDGLHQRAGSRAVLELHGNLTRARCDAGCGRTRPAAEIDPGRLRCPCGAGRWRPDVVWFGEPLSPKVLDGAREAVESAAMAWVVGTSSVVYPAASLPRHAAERGVLVVEVNPDPTPLSPLLRFVLRDAAGSGLAALAGVWAETRGMPAPAFEVSS